VTEDGIEIGRAKAGDIDGILALQAQNQPATGGTLSAALPRERIAAMVAGPMPIIVARRAGGVVGYLIAAEREAVRGIPIIAAMLEAYPGDPSAYVYGPICIAAAERGRGLAQSLFESLKALLPEREGILFIRADNAASLRAHEKMGVRRVGSFSFADTAIVVLAYRG
jgi:predicted GNAT superfamily acetyltransferase